MSTTTRTELVTIALKDEWERLSKEMDSPSLTDERQAVIVDLLSEIEETVGEEVLSEWLGVEAEAAPLTSKEVGTELDALLAIVARRQAA